MMVATRREYNNKAPEAKRGRQRNKKHVQLFEGLTDRPVRLKHRIVEIQIRLSFVLEIQIRFGFVVEIQNGVAPSLRLEMPHLLSNTTQQRENVRILCLQKIRKGL